MKALIFNSGTGSRLGGLTSNSPKSMVRLLSTGETILYRQLRILHDCGIRDFVITTGPQPEQVMDVASHFVARGCNVAFVPNPIYAETNYIYSMHRAADYLRESDFLLLHGDLVFDAAYAQALIDSPHASAGSVNAALPLPEKDFKARVVDGQVREVSVNIFDEDCVAFQPFYKLSQEALGIWLAHVAAFCEAGDTKVYAENAANEVFEQMGVVAFSYEGHCVEEIDNTDDLIRVSAQIVEFEQEVQ